MTTQRNVLVAAVLTFASVGVRAEHVGRPPTTPSPPETVRPALYPGAAARRTATNDADDPWAALDRFLRLHSAMRYREAEVVARRLVGLVPDRPITHYNHACALARLQRRSEALEAIDRAVALGWRNIAHTVIDPDLAGLREADAFQTLIDRMHALERDERVIASPLRVDPSARVVEDLEHSIPELLERYHVPGVTVALVRDGVTVWQGGFGGTIDADTVFELSAPDHLLALVAAAQMDASSRLDLAALLSDGSTHAEAGGLLRRAVESASRTPFDVYCREHIARPFRLRSTTRVAPDAPIALAYDDFGRAVPTGPSGAGHRSMFTTADDLARLMAALMRGADCDVRASGRRSYIDVLAGLHTPALRRHGIPLSVDQTTFGQRIELASATRGSGCLVRWYPDARCGIVVLFNSDSGIEAAERIAALALGGA